MGDGATSTWCFSWFPVPWKSRRKRETAAQEKYIPVVVPNSNNKEIFSTAEYVMDGGKQAIQVLEAAAGLLPVPYIKDAISIGLKVVEACEEVSAVEQQVLALQDRVCILMITIVDSVTVQDDSVESVLKAAQEIEDDVKALHGNLQIIVKDLDDIKNQNRWILFFFKDLNKSKVDDCMKRLTVALERFNLSNDLRTASVLERIQARLEKIYGLTQEVSGQVRDLGAKIDNGFSTILSALEETKAQTASTAFVRQQMPLKPRIFYGRDDLVEEVALLLSNEKTSKVCILGPGGMGKTSVALAVVESSSVQARFSSANRFWVPCLEATSPSLFLQILSISLRVTRDTKNALEDILYELNTSSEPRLILIDNFETTWHLSDGRQKEVNDIICRLANLNHVALLVTMRGTYPPSYDIEWQSKNLPPTDEEACRRIYQDINPGAINDPDIGDLLKALGHMPFAVTLMAMLAKEGQASARDLLEEWSRAGPDMISPADTPEKSMNRSISLSVDSNLVKRNPDALILLATLSMLPAGTTRKNLNWWAPRLQSQSAAIATLSKAALLMVNEVNGLGLEPPTLFVLPVVQSYMQSSNRIPPEVQEHVFEACRKHVLDHASRPRDPKFKEDVAALVMEDTNIQFVLFNLMIPGVIGETLDANKNADQSACIEVLKSLLAFSWYRAYTHPSVDLAIQTLNVARASASKKPLAEALYCLGTAYNKLERFELAKTHLEAARRSFKALSADRDALIRAGECGFELADNMRYLQVDSDNIIDLVREMQADYETLSDEYGLARCLTELGIAYNYSADYDASLRFLHEGRQALENFGHQSVDVARCLLTMGMSYHALGRNREALEPIMQGLEIAEHVGDEYLLGDSEYVSGKILGELDQNAEALQYAKRSLLSHQRTGRPLGFAQSLELIGYLYLRQHQFQDGCEAYEAAYEAYTNTGPISMAKSGAEQCRVNLTKIRRKLENPEEKIVFLGLDIDQLLP